MSDIHLETVTRNLRLCYRFDPPKGYRAGKREIAKLLMRFYDCSRPKARSILDRLEKRGFAYVDERRKGASWRFEPHPVPAD